MLFIDREDGCAWPCGYEREPRMPPDLLYVASLHSMTYPRPFQKLPMQLKYWQKSPGGLVIDASPQKLYPHGLVGAPHRFLLEARCWPGA